MTFHKTIQTVLLAASLSYVASAQSDRLQAGTQVTVRINDTIEAKDSNEGRIYTGVVDQDVTDRSGRVVIPRGSDAELIVRDTSDRSLLLDLESVKVNGRRYSVSTTEENVGTDSGNSREGIGKNSRTGKYVGGGAVIGSIIGAIAGGGKGAAIGAATGAGAGAATQTVTKGGNVRVPSESLVTFRLDRPLTIVEPDPGYDRDGRHYHRYEGSRSRSNYR